MVLQKSIILVFLLLFIQPADDKKPQDSGSVKKLIIGSELNKENLRLTEISINDADTSTLVLFSNDLLPGWQKAYLQCLILKKEGKSSEIYDSLISYIDQKPDYLPYYDLLVSSAGAENRLTFIDKLISEKEFDPVVKHYLSSLLLKGKAEYQAAIADALKADELSPHNYYLIYNLYDIYRHTGNYEKGMEYVLKIFNQRNLLPADRAEANYAAGTLLFNSGIYSDAEKYYIRGNQIASDNKLYTQMAKGDINIGIIEDLNGNTDDARLHFKKALDIARSISNLAMEAHALSELGVSYSFTNDLVSAKLNYLESYHLFKRLGERQRLSYLSENLGKIYLQLFDYNSALKYYEDGVQFAGDNRRAQVLNLTGMADVYANLSNYTKALLYYKEAEKIASEIKEASLTAEINLGMGILNYNLNRNGNALRYLSAAGNYSAEAGDIYLSARICREMGQIYTDSDSLDKAESLFLKAQELAVQSRDAYLRAQTLIDLGNIKGLRKEYNSALEKIDSGLRLAQSNGYDYLTALGKYTRGEVCLNSGDFAAAKSALLASAALSEKLNEQNLSIASNQALAELYDKHGFTEAASSHYISAMQLIDNVSASLFGNEDIQISYFSGKRDLYDSYAGFLLDKKYYANAFEVIDKSRSRSTVQHLNNLKIREYVKDQDQLNRIYEYDWILNSGVYEEDKTDSVRYLDSKLKKEITKKYPSLAGYLDKKKFLEVNDIQDKLNDDENILSIYTMDSGTYIFVISKNHFHYNFVPLGESKIDNLIKAVSPYFNYAGEGAYFNQHLFSYNARAAYQLYDQVFKEAFKNIPEGKKLIISPSAEFASFPFEFLVKSFDEKGSPYDYKNQDYLLAHYTISYTPSVNTYIGQKQNRLKNNNRVLVVGNPSINRQLEGYAERRGLLDETGGIPRDIPLLPLKYSAEEVSEVSSILNADKILLANSATESNFKNNASFSRIIHLSTHSFLYNKQPVIFFSNSYDAENDGFLEAGEIVQMELNSDLVVLSSCNSGLGRLDESEGVLGMSKAFFEAGTKSVIASLWEVNDKYTAIFMSLFYQRLKEGVDKSKALQLAKMDFIKEYSPNPYYWSAFVLNGDTSNLKIESGVQIQIYLAGLAIILLLALIISAAVKRNNRKGCRPNRASYFHSNTYLSMLRLYRATERGNLKVYFKSRVCDFI